jgi:hypothetical protein
MTEIPADVTVVGVDGNVTLAVFCQGMYAKAGRTPTL